MTRAGYDCRAQPGPRYGPIMRHGIGPVSRNNAAPPSWVRYLLRDKRMGPVGVDRSVRTGPGPVGWVGAAR